MINFVAVKILTNDEKNCSEHFWGIFMQLLSPLSHCNNILHTLFFFNKNFLLSNQWLKNKMYMYQVKKYTSTSRRNNIMYNTTDQDEKKWGQSKCKWKAISNYLHVGRMYLNFTPKNTWTSCSLEFKNWNKTTEYY